MNLNMSRYIKKNYVYRNARMTYNLEEGIIKE